MDDQGELAGEPPDVAAEGEVAEAGGRVDQEVGDDQGGGAAAELVEAAEEQAEGEVAEEAPEALVEVVGAAEEGAGPEGLGGGPAELVEAAEQVAADDHLFEQAAAGGGQQEHRDRPPVAGGGDRDHGAVDPEAGGQADPPAQVVPGAGGVEADAGRRLAGAVQKVEDEGDRHDRGGQVEQLVDQPDVGEQGCLDPADGRRQDVDDRVQGRRGQRQGQHERHFVPQHPSPGQGGREPRAGGFRGGLRWGFGGVHGTTVTASATLDFMNRDFMGALRERVLVFDGAMGTMLQNAGLSLDDYQGLEGCSEILCVSRPDVVRDIHAAYFEAGADAVETNSFGSSAIVLAEYDIADQVVPLNRLAAQLAREVADDFQGDGRPRWVAGSIGPGTKLPTLGHTTYDVLKGTYADQAFGLLEGGADLLLIETCQDLLQVKSAVAGAYAGMERAGRRVPVITQVTVKTTGQMLLGSDIAAALTAIEPLGVDVLGMNCATGPAEMGEHLRYLAQHARTPLSCLPNAGLPELRVGDPWYPLTPAELAEAHTRFASEFGLSVVGGCCGTTPEHIRQVVEALGGRAPAPREPDHEPSLSSLYQSIPLDQDTTYLTVGERCNANGSRKFRDLMLEGDLEGMVGIAKEQIREGAHVLDVCVDYVGRDGVPDMDVLAARLAQQSTVPVMLDSTQADVLEAGLKRLGGRAIINSINLEDGEARMDAVCPMARQYGAALVALLIDEEGQARDVDWKLRIAHRIHDLAVDKHGLAAEDLVFDALTFPLGSGQEDLRGDAMATLEAIRRIKAELPGVRTILGVSNVSFGLAPAARQVLNSVFLHEAREAGLDAAIVAPARILPMHRIEDEQRQVALDLIYDRRREGYDPLQKFMALFEGKEVAKAASAEDLAALPIDERLQRRIVDGVRDGLEADLAEAMAARSPLSIINEVLLAGMKTVGELFGAGEMQLPFVLQSAEVMKAAVAVLEPHMEKADQGGKGRVVLATVKGDVHDIGKNLVDIILTNNGYTVHNIGIKQPITTIIEKAEEVGADAIGMSGLLVKSTIVMRDNLEELNARGLASYPVLLGGAALNRTYVEGDLRQIYKGRVFYCRDAFAGLRVMDQLREEREQGVEPAKEPVRAPRVVPVRPRGPAPAPPRPPSWPARTWPSTCPCP